MVPPSIIPRTPQKGGSWLLVVAVEFRSLPALDVDVSIRILCTVIHPLMIHSLQSTVSQNQLHLSILWCFTPHSRWMSRHYERSFTFCTTLDKIRNNGTEETQYGDQQRSQQSWMTSIESQEQSMLGFSTCPETMGMSFLYCTVLPGFVLC